MAPKRKIKHFKQEASVSKNEGKLWWDEEESEEKVIEECMNDVSKEDKETRNSRMCYPFKMYKRKKMRDDEAYGLSAYESLEMSLKEACQLPHLSTSLIPTTTQLEEEVLTLHQPSNPTPTFTSNKIVGGTRSPSNMGQTTTRSLQKDKNHDEGRRDILVTENQILTREGLSKVNQVIPFKKTSSFWTTLECMEAFQKIPQNPHFYPLHECPLGLREGTAIGLMITFSTLVTELSNVQKDDLNNFLKSYRNVIDDLEKHGFDVKRVRNRFNELQAINDMKERHEEELMSIETKMIEIVCEKINLQLEIDCVAQKRKELVAKLNEITRIRWEEDSKKGSLRSSAKVISAELKKIQGDIKFLVRPFW